VERENKANLAGPACELGIGQGETWLRRRPVVHWGPANRITDSIDTVSWEDLI